MEDDLTCPYCYGTGLTPDPAAVGAEMRELRRAHHKTQIDMAHELGCDQSLVSQLETGQKRWTPRMIERYKQAVEA